MFDFLKTKKNEMKWTIILINESDWYIKYIKNKLIYQIDKLKLQEKINIHILKNIEEIENIFSECGDYINIIESGEISDHYIESIYNKIKNGKKDCIGLSGIVYIDDKPKFFNQDTEENKHHLPICKFNPIRKDIIQNIEKYWELDLSKIIKSKIDIKEPIIFIENKIPISIIITAYQSQDFIEECLDSIENQTYFKNNNEFEVLIGVDHCTDTLEKINEIKDKYRNLSVYMMSENKGTYITTNTLIDFVKYENVIRFDSDDIMCNDLVENVIKNKKDYDIIRIGFSDFVDGNYENEIKVSDGIIYFKKNIMDNIAGGYMPWVCAADTELINRIKNKVKIFDLNERLFYRRIHDNSLTNRYDTGYNSAIRIDYLKQIRVYSEDEETKINKVINKLHYYNENDLSDNFYSIVIPTMWCSDKIFNMLPVYNDSPYVKEIIIIDNDPSKKQDLSTYDKIRYFTKGKNIYVNPSWNWGYSLSNYKLILANDDIIIDDFDDVLKTISESDKDIIGIDLKSRGEKIKIDDIDDFPANSYGCFMYIKNYIFIPEQFKIWYGDDFLFKYNKKRGILKNIKIKTNKSETIDSNRTNQLEFRENIGKKDIEHYSNLIKKDSENFNIIIRTSGRPIYFNKCIDSIRKNYKNAKIHVIIDDIEDLNYVENCVYDFNYVYYLVNKETIENICKKIPIERNLFIYNYYFNVVRPFLYGWCLFLDDDDILLITPDFDKNKTDNIYLHRVDIGKKIVPVDSNFGKYPVLNDISGLGIIFHSTKMKEWLPQRGGDYSFISMMYDTTKPIWIDKVISKTQDRGNFGKRNDASSFDKQITVNMATYPPRKESLIKVINELLKIDLINKIRIYLNEYDNIPDDLPINEKILYHIGEKNLKDSGKYYWSSTYKDEYYFTLDDDLIYPGSFFVNHVLLLKRYDNDIFVTSHGKEMVDLPSVFNEHVKSYHCLKDVHENVWINNGGTGVMVFDNSRFIIPIELFQYHGMADLWISLYCQRSRIPILCRKHKYDELIYIDQNDTLFDRRDEMKTEHRKILDLIGVWKLYKK